MKESVLDLLMYLFENYIYDEPEVEPDRDALGDSLEEAGFTRNEIERAFDWLDELVVQRSLPELGDRGSNPIRIFTETESRQLDIQARGFIIYLENIGVLDAMRREQVIDRLTALDYEDISLDDVKWVVLMVLFNQPGQEANYAWMEDLMFDEQGAWQH
ncbi:MAG TPA: DUF494 domain-containing protein [Wenzhouxiangella sp.]|nr:DUF494 domain-containing protein [Wenzhouxiangella sp.]